MAISTYLEDALLNAVLRGVAYTSPTTVYMALFTTIPTDANIGTEPPGSAGYARQAVTFDVPAGGSVQNLSTVTFGPATVSWGQVRWVGIYDAATAGNLLFWGSLASPKDIGVGQSLVFAAGEVNITLD